MKHVLKQFFWIALWSAGIGLMGLSGPCQASALVTMSRQAAALILAKMPNGTTEIGSGFFLDSTHIATCFHVVYSSPSLTNKSGPFTPAAAIKVILSDGEETSAVSTLLPAAQSTAPFTHDFAILKLAAVPKMTVVPSPLAADTRQEAVGADIVFSGYPLIDQSPSFDLSNLSTAFLHTFFGKISGFSKDGSILGLQAPVNLGSSGSGVLNAKGEVIAIITYEHSNFEAFYQQALNTPISADKLSDPEKKVTALLFTVINRLSQTSSNGIGYAQSVDALRSYLKQYPSVLKN